MSGFHINETAFRAILRIDSRICLVVTRNSDSPDDCAQWSITAYPLTDGHIWDEPYEAFMVEEAGIIELEQQMKE